ncbi:MAG: NAD(P)H-dependent oxidoreductase [Porticoccaceae bacterium]|jgi:FMN-dependent NADH-azoreductase|nr:NAD(P)H-dependent oxidoreductase [Porticoccaceae bacterium]MEA3300140.1 NAD(P)H-dependent oxidoreductase [Pseudomonadota bacterium]HLS97920.1 NAD(P)H-dependent oxidoreductase [Porticoccaceae bacterium]
MANILVIESSARLAGYSRQLTGEFVDKLRAQGKHRFVFRDLVAEPIPVLTNDNVDIIRTHPDQITPEQLAKIAVSEQLIGELYEADFVVIGSSMYNWNVSASLKAWLDQVMRIGKTFTYGGDGVVGLLGDKPCLVVLARGGSYDSPERAARDMQQPYLANVLKVMGLDATFAVMEGSLMGDEARDTNLAKARAVIERVAATLA